MTHVAAAIITLGKWFLIMRAELRAGAGLKNDAKKNVERKYIMDEIFFVNNL
jgi:hypothetical protein